MDRPFWRVVVVVVVRGHRSGQPLNGSTFGEARFEPVRVRGARCWGPRVMDLHIPVTGPKVCHLVDKTVLIIVVLIGWRSLVISATAERPSPLRTTLVWLIRRSWKNDGTFLMLLEDWPLSSPSTPPLVSMVWADGLLASRYAHFHNCHRFAFSQLTLLLNQVKLHMTVYLIPLLWIQDCPWKEWNRAYICQRLFNQKCKLKNIMSEAIPEWAPPFPPLAPRSGNLAHICKGGCDGGVAWRSISGHYTDFLYLFSWVLEQGSL